MSKSETHPTGHNRLSKPFTPHVSRMLEDLISRQMPFYVRMQTPPLEAQAAFLLNMLISGKRRKTPRYHAFFCSSTYEAISGALKIVRHNHFVEKPHSENITAVYDISNTLRTLFDPLDKGPEEALVPGISYFDDLDQFTAFIEDGAASTLVLGSLDTITTTRIDEILEFSSRRRIYTILDESSTDFHAMAPVSSRLAAVPDVIVFGENLTDHRVPAGCFLTTRHKYRVWNNLRDYNIHSNTWGGNSVTVSAMLDFLQATPSCKALPRKVLDTIDKASTSHRHACKLYAKYCSPKMATMLDLSSLNKDIVAASKRTLRIKSHDRAIDVIDASGTYGVNLRGHNPDDIITSVLRTHDASHDYWADLRNVLHQKTTLPHVFPAVSGATATEIAIAMALLANAPKKTILALDMGYHGKTLIALATTARPRIKTPFAPLYPHVVYLDPFSDTIEDDLRRHLSTNDVALVLLETIQGEGGVRACPQRLFDALHESRDRYGCLIGIDEVQTGIYRTGKFLNYEGKIDSPDLVAVAKGLSDSVFPVAASLVTDAVYEKARDKNGEFVSLCSELYRCQFGAHVAEHAIAVADETRLVEHVAAMGEYFRARLWEVAERTKAVKNIRGEGLMIGLELDGEKTPRMLRNSLGGLITARCVNDPVHPIFVAFTPDKPLLLRYLPPLTITREEIDTIAGTMERSLKASVGKLVVPIAMKAWNPTIWRR